MPQQFLVIGGTGQTGRHITRKLLQHGFGTRVLARHAGSAQQQLGPEVEIVAGDITQAASVAEAMRDVAGCVIIVESADSDHAPNSPQRVHYEGTRHVIAAAAGQTPQIVLVTQIYITRPERYPEVRNVIHWRAQAEQALRVSGLPYTIVRPSWLSNETGGQAAIRFEQGDTGEGQISREDVAEVCVQSLLVPQARGKTFEIYNEPGQAPQEWPQIFGRLKSDPQH